MKEAVLVVIKPDAITRRLTGHVLAKFAQSGLEMVAIKLAKTSRELAEQHYAHLRGKPFFEEVVAYFLGKYHQQKKLIAIIYYGENAIARCRKIAGATNPEEACPESIRGAYGRITTKGVYENVVHVSSDAVEAEREIKLWFSPMDITRKIYPVKYKVISAHKEKVWA